MNIFQMIRLTPIKILVATLLLVWNTSQAAIRTSVASGNWSTTTTWTPAGIPLSTDTVIIADGHIVTIDAARTVLGLQINTGGTLNWPSNNPRALTVNGAITINGTLNMTGDILFNNPRTVTIGAGGTLIWSPNTNTLTGATLFTNGIENYDLTSNLIIKKWYDYVNVPLTSVVGCDFGNLTLNSPSSNNAIAEWNQNNGFQTRKVLGTLTIDAGWITLDKSGSITNTILNNVVLNSANSYLYLHNGTHPSTATVTMSNLTNNGGTFWGLNNGNGNIQLDVNGNLTNSGSIKLINNSGVAGVSSGNAGLTVGGVYTQTAGDSRFIYNVSTLNSGTYSATIGSMNFNGGTFMGLTGVHTGNGICTLNILNNLNISFAATTDIFRGISMTTIGTTNNTARFVMNVGGNMTVSGPSASEFTTSASTGTEQVAISNNYAVSGGTNSFNYGTAAAAHNNQLIVGGNFSVSNGTVHASRLAGTLEMNIGGSGTISAGTVSLKSSTGAANASVNGNFTLSGGTFYFHFNASETTTNPVNLTVNGNFAHSGGTMNFDDNNADLGAQHTLTLLGQDYSISGSGVITHAGPGNSEAFGMISFARNGFINYSRATTHFLTQVKQRVENACTLKVVTGPVQVASFKRAGTDFFRICSGARMEMLNAQIGSNSQYSNSGMQVDSSGTFATARPNGLYDGTLNGTINSNGNMDFYLHAKSMVEYYGYGNQVLTGTGVGIATGIQHQYGFLKINLKGPSTTNASPVNNNVFVRSQLQLDQGEVFLNSFAINIMNGNPDGIKRVNGYIKSELNANNNTSKIIWQDFQPGPHEFPFGLNATTYLPVTFRAYGNFGTGVSIATRATAASDNQPIPPNIALNGVNNNVPIPPYCPHAITEVVDRWWHINVTGNMDADVTLSYVAGENTLTLQQTGPLGIASWVSNYWTYPMGTGNGITNGIGTVTAYGIRDFNHMILVANSVVLPVQLLDFQAKSLNGKVILDWATSSEINNDFFTVERSKNGTDFEPVSEVDGAGNSSHIIRYTSEDSAPMRGNSYYRLRQTDFDGKYSYSEIRMVGQREGSESPIAIEEIGPNPFENSFHAVIGKSMPGTAVYQIYDLAGKKVYERSEESEAGNSVVEFNDLPALAPGTYMFHAIAGNQVETKKIIRK